VNELIKITDTEKYGSGDARGIQRPPSEDSSYKKFNARW
jgi:hypothetical protein